MKTTLAILVWLAANVSFAASGTTVGNGGNSIVCKNSAGKVTSVEMLDLYEARINGLTLKFNSRLSSYKDVINENLDRWQDVAPRRVAQYKKWLDEFESETMFVSGIQIPVIPDTGSVVLPKGCELKPIAFQRPESELLPGVKRYTVSRDLWNLMDEVQRAGLVMHELIYREGILAEHKTSFPTRYFNGYLATAEPDALGYASVVIQLPLMWVEYRGLSLKVLGDDWRSGRYTRLSSVSNEGQVEGQVDSVSDDIILDNFSLIHPRIIDLLPHDYPIYVLAKPDRFELRYDFVADRVRFSSDRFHFEVNTAGHRMRGIYSGTEVRARPWIVVGGAPGYFSVTNPAASWLITKANHRISNITGIKFSRYLPQDRSVFTFGSDSVAAHEFIIGDGETWVWDETTSDYVLKQ